jgi:hypothetical protein
MMINSTGALALAVAAAATVARVLFQRRRAARGAEDPRMRAPAVVPPGPVTRLRGDFNGVFGQLLCLSHEDYSLDDTGQKVWLREGMAVLAWEEDSGDDGQPDNLVATGLVERAPAWLNHRGSKWVLWMDSRGVHHESDIRGAAEQ